MEEKKHKVELNDETAVKRKEKEEREQKKKQRIKKRLPTHIDVKSALVPSVALCEQVNTIAKDRLSTYIGVCTKAEMAAIDRGLLIQLGLKLQRA